MKGQVLADFVVEFSPRYEGEIVCQVGCRRWKVFMDGASSTMKAGVGIVIVTPEGIQLEHSFRLGFRASNNKAEYEALLAGLKTVLGMGAWMKEYLRMVKHVMGKFCTAKIVQVAWGQNRHADTPIL